MKLLLSQIKILFTNRIGFVLIFANFVLAFWGLAQKGWNYNTFHFYYEPLPTKIFTIVNLPAIAFAELINNLLYSPPKAGTSLIEISNGELLLSIVFSIFQWLLIGYLLDLMVCLKQRKIK